MSDITPIPQGATDPAPMPAEAVAAPAVPAGWYPDPDSPGIQRWWTGNGWSDHRAPLVSAAPRAAKPTTVVINNKKQTNHAFHLIMTLLTLGLWLPVWIIVAIVN